MSYHDQDAPHTERRRLIAWCDWCRRGPCRGWVWLYWSVRRQCWRRVPSARRGEFPRLCERCHGLDSLVSGYEAAGDDWPGDVFRMGVN